MILRGADITGPAAPGRAPGAGVCSRPVIAHLDLDAFFAAVELHRRPELRGRPLVVGGDPDARGVVATASYAARRYGIRSAMGSAEARRRCPDVVFVPPDHAHYRDWSRRVWALVREMVPLVEPTGIDEGYLQLPGSDPVGTARAVQGRVRGELRLSCSLGVATCKVVAKVASDARKPGGLTVVAVGREADFLAPLALRTLPGIGPQTERRLLAAGVRTLGDLAALDDDALRATVPGAVGDLLRRRAQGIDPRPVVGEPAAAVSISAERTFERDIDDPSEQAAQLVRMADGVAAALERHGLAARTVTVKLRYPDFQTRTRSQTVESPTRDAARIADLAEAGLRRALEERPGALRLLGVAVSGLAPDRQLSLFGS
jgi:DNA polymerase-4